MQEDLRKRYDRGEDVSDRARDRMSKNKDFHGFQFNFEEDGDKVRAWFLNPETGEKEYIDLDVNTHQETDADGRPKMPRHCCIAFEAPEPAASAGSGKQWFLFFNF